jgi:hypothetical protein
MHPEDARLFAPEQWPALRSAVAELSWLLSRGYAEPSALKLVGDRHRLDARQRMAVMRSACTDEALARRASTRVDVGDVRGQAIDIDGYNVLTTVEAALSGGVILAARDGTYRDVASIHGSYRKVEETRPAIRLIAQTLERLGATDCRWLLDSPVSNSGRLRAILLEEAPATRWEVQIVADPDSLLCQSDRIVCSADSVILDSAVRWFNLAREVVLSAVADACVVDLMQSLPALFLPCSGLGKLL